MFAFIFNQILFYFGVVLLLFLPGYFLLRVIFKQKSPFSSEEKFLLSLALSVGIVDFFMLILGKIGLPLSRGFLFGTVFLFIVLLIYLPSLFDKIKFLRQIKKRLAIKKAGITFEKLPRLSQKQKLLIILTLFLTVFIKTIYLEKTVFPTSTDMGHHMYWAKLITTSEQLPVYVESDIIQTSGGYAISQPEPIADFIIGEHLIFAALGSLTKADFVSAFPSLVLLLFNIATALAIFVLARQIFQKHPQGSNIAILALFLAGPLFALASPQAKFVSGGVIGNTLGNFFIPIILLLLLKALEQRKSVFLSLALFLSLTLVYTHHLSTFVFLFSLISTFLIFFLFNLKKIPAYLKNWLRLIASPWIWLVIVFGIWMVFEIYIPSYLNSSAVGTAVGTPSKSTRTGLSFQQLASATGQIRLILALLGMILIVWQKRLRNYGETLLFAWAFVIFIMSLFPGWLFVDIPSSRIGNYLIFPLIILAAFALVEFFNFFKTQNSSRFTFLKPFYVILIFFILSALIAQNGMSDNATSLSDGGNSQAALQTFQASAYLSKFTNSKDVVLKDHNYLTADSWIKLYFMNGYNFPFSRSYFKRYEDAVNEREQCTLQMISTPNSPEAQKCFEGTGVNFLMINPLYDSAQFKKNREFWQIYSSDEIGIFYKTD